MSNCNCNNKPYTVTSIHDVDIDDLATLPDYLFAVRKIDDPSTGTSIMTPVLAPTGKIAPTANMANVVALTTNNSALEIPENQVLAGYYDRQPGGAIMKLADATHPAEFLMLGKYGEGKTLVQTTGFLNFKNGHSYIPGAVYYTGENGMPVTDSTSGQKLFKVIDDSIINVDGDF